MQQINLNCPNNCITQWAIMDKVWYYRFVPFVGLEEGDKDAYYGWKIDMTVRIKWNKFEDKLSNK